MAKYTCDMCGKKNLKQEEVKEVCLECFSKVALDELSIIELVKRRLSKEDLRFIQQQNKNTEKYSEKDYIQISQKIPQKI